MAEVAPVAVGTSAHAETLRRDGFRLLRGAIPAPWREALRAEFDAGGKPNHPWPVPRGVD